MGWVRFPETFMESDSVLRTLTLSARSLFTDINSHFPICRMKSNTLMKLSGIKSKDTYYRALKELKKVRLIDWEKGTYKKQVAVITMGEVFKKYIKEEKEPILKNSIGPILKIRTREVYKRSKTTTDVDSFSGNNTNKKSKVSSKAKKLAQEWKTWGWPKGSQGDLPAAIQVSLQNYERFRRDILAYKKEHLESPNRKKKRVARFIRYLSNEMGWGFIKKWFKDTHKKVIHWDEWSGKLQPLNFDIKHKRLKQWVQDITRRYSNNENLWGELMEEVFDED